MPVSNLTAPTFEVFKGFYHLKSRHAKSCTETRRLSDNIWNLSNTHAFDLDGFTRVQ